MFTNHANKQTKPTAHAIGHYLSFKLFATFIVVIFLVHLIKLWSFRGELTQIIPPMIFWNVLAFLCLFISLYIEAALRHERIPSLKNRTKLNEEKGADAEWVAQEEKLKNETKN